MVELGRRGAVVAAPAAVEGPAAGVVGGCCAGGVEAQAAAVAVISAAKIAVRRIATGFQRTRLGCRVMGNSICVSQLTGHWESVGWVALKAFLMYVSALLALRIGERRTLAQWTVIDFVGAVAMGAIVGRTSLASNQSYVFGLVAIATLVLAHRVASVVRFSEYGNRIIDHRVRILVAHGQIRPRELRRCGLTDNDLFMQLRQRGIESLDGIRYVIYETKGSISVVNEPAGDQGTEVDDLPLVKAALEGSVGYPDWRSRPPD